MVKLNKSYYREEMASTIEAMGVSKRYMKFWFDFRHHATNHFPPEFSSNYEYHKSQFYLLKSNYRFLQRRLNKLAEKYMSLYADN